MNGPFRNQNFGKVVYLCILQIICRKVVLDLDSLPFAPKIVAEMIATTTSTEV